jgi:hypothetical protein
MDLNYSLGIDMLAMSADESEQLVSAYEAKYCDRLIQVGKQ